MSQANLAVGAHPSAGVMEESPFSIPSRKLVMWLFIASDAVTFGAVLFGYGYLRNSTANWPHPFEFSSVLNAMIMTFVLVTSSLTMLLAIRAAKLGDKSKAVLWSFVTVIGGLLF
ncbi:MAG: cytochrome c oxidase subunit, partial [Acidobacteriaceae bacterium]|nr:cytochrome c oxidase subunit [Acidobacteriaceae bacterium]